jgi:hypothetical protein
MFGPGVRLMPSAMSAIPVAEAALINDDSFLRR